MSESANAEVREHLHDPRHWQFFSEFVKWETAVGGPDPHMATTGHLVRDLDWEERTWRGGCYLSVYNVAGGEALWNHWSLEDALNRPHLIEPWIRKHWEGIPFRRERRAVRTPVKLARHLVSYSQWMKQARDCGWWTGDYEAAWKAADQIYGVGRYIKHKLLEYLHRYCGLEPSLSDIRAKGAWSPRGTLALLYPEFANGLLGDDSHTNVTTAESCATHAKYRLLKDYGLDITYYDLQVMLCEYRESFLSRRQFPGRSHDSEFMHAKKIDWYWPYDTEIYAARADIFPHEALGEIQGWPGRREELGTVLRDHGYTWADLKYDYMATNDLANPVLR